MIVGYRRYLSFLIDSLQRDYSNLNHVVDDLVFDFKQYVLSQMHLGIWCHYYGRSLYTIYEVYRGLEFKEVMSDLALYQVLSWYYADLALFLRGIASQGYLSDVKISLSVSLALERVPVSFHEERDKVLHCIKSGEVTEYSKFIDLSFSDLSKFDELFITEISFDRFISSVILSKFSEKNIGKIIDMGGVIECH